MKRDSTSWCPDCYRAKRFLRDHGVVYEEVDIERDPTAAALVMKRNEGKRPAPTFDIEGQRYGTPSLGEPEKWLGVG